MSDATPTPIESIEAATDTIVEATSETVVAAMKPVDAAIDAALAPARKPAAVKAAVAKAVVAAAPKASKRAPAKRAPAKRATAKRASKPSIAKSPAPAPKAVAKPTRKAATVVAKRKYVRKAATSVKPLVSPITTPTSIYTNPFSQGTKTMDTTTFFAPFTSVPGADKFQSMFAGAGEKSQEVVKKGQAIAEQMTETAKANLEAVVESGRIAAAGARDLGQELVASTKGGVEHATAAVKTLTEAKSPTEFFQLQSEMMKASFDRMVAEGSKFTEHMVKLAGEATQPLSNRASVNAEKFSELTA